MPKVSGGGSEYAPSRVYTWHGLELAPGPGSQAIGDCPWCGREGKWYVNVETGQSHCQVCENPSNNPVTFLQQLWERSHAATLDYQALADERKLLYPDTLDHWGVCQSIFTRAWLVPGWGASGTVNQLYMRVQDRSSGKWHWQPSPGLDPNHERHGLHGRHLWDKNNDKVFICEGVWDGMALWEALRVAGIEANVLAVPACGVWYESWNELCAGRSVALLYDSDHPRKNPKTGVVTSPAGHHHMARVAGLLANAGTPPREIQYLWWGKDGYEPAQKSGFDIGDMLTAGERAGSTRQSNLQAVLDRLMPVPEEWLTVRRLNPRAVVGTEYCSSWGELIAAWRKALRWRRELDDALSVMLAVALSMPQQGDQLFLQLIGSASGGKTKLCDGMLTSANCYALEHLTGFHSGYNDGSGDDFSILARANRKVWITPEGDVLMSSPRFAELMSQQRRIFDGTSGASYKNRKQDMRYVGLRTPWIIAGTPELLNTDQSRLGDRFLRCRIEEPDEEEKLHIMRKACYTAMREAAQSSNGSPDSTTEPGMLRAYKLTGGYVDWLLAQTERIDYHPDGEAELIEHYMSRALFIADMRARPRLDYRHVHETEASKEQPTRLVKQLARLALCLRVVLQKRDIDREVLRRLDKVALDTAWGRSLVMSRLVNGNGRSGVNLRRLCSETGRTPEAELAYLRFLREIDVVESFRPTLASNVRGKARWRLTARFDKLWSEVVNT